MKTRIKALKDLIQFASDHERLENEVSSFEEVLCQFFDDLDIEEIIESNLSETALTPKQLNLLNLLKDKLNVSYDKFEDFSSSELILNSKEWKEVESVALELNESWPGS
jgi:hypothetical protein